MLSMAAQKAAMFNESLMYCVRYCTIGIKEPAVSAEVFA